MEVSGAAVPSVERMEVGLLSSARAWLRTEPAMKDTRNTVMNCITEHWGISAYNNRLPHTHEMQARAAFWPLQIHSVQDARQLCGQCKDCMELTSPKDRRGAHLEDVEL